MRRLIDSLLEWWHGRAPPLPPSVAPGTRGRIVRRAPGPDGEQRLKFVHVGRRSGLGEFSLLTRWINDTFRPAQFDFKHHGMDFMVKQLQHGGERLKVFAWTIAHGNEKFPHLRRPYFRGADGILLLYDITCRATFEHVTVEWTELLRETLVPEGYACALVGCKSDLVGAREVSEAEAEAFAAEHEMPFFETSAKDGMGVQEAYASLLQQLAGEEVPPQERGAAVAIPCAEAPEEVADGTKMVTRVPAAVHAAGAGAGAGVAASPADATCHLLKISSSRSSSSDDE